MKTLYFITSDKKMTQQFVIVYQTTRHFYNIFDFHRLPLQVPHVFTFFSRKTSGKSHKCVLNYGYSSGKDGSYGKKQACGTQSRLSGNRADFGRISLFGHDVRNLCAHTRLQFSVSAFDELTIFAGSMEFVTVNMLLGAFDPFSAFLMALMTRAHLFYGIAML